MNFLRNTHTSLFTLIILCLSLILLGSNASSYAVGRDNDIPVLKEGFYVVVGAFSLKRNAIRYAEHINASKGENSKIGLNDKKNIYYVYVLGTQNLEVAKEKWLEYRSKPDFESTWVFKNISMSNDGFINIEDKEAIARAKEQNKEIFEDPEEKKAKQPEPEVKTPPEGSTNKENEHKYVFNVVNARTLKEVPGFITVVDAARQQEMTSVKTNTLQHIPEPTTVTKEVIFICDIFGYVKQQVALKIDEPLKSNEPNVAMVGDTTLVGFDLIRHKKGDIITMYQVYFYNDAAVMKPESKFELNSLLNMLNENEDLEIKIHGHTNGNAPGKIVALKDGDENFFKITDNNEEGYGSAKKLSEQRATTIKRWLINQGIDKNRMKVKGWGGKKMLYDKRSSNAEKNVRVEIELLND